MKECDDVLRVKVLAAKWALEDLVREVNCRQKEFKPFNVLIKLDLNNHISNHLCIFENSFSELNGLLVSSCYQFDEIDEE